MFALQHREQTLKTSHLQCELTRWTLSRLKLLLETFKWGKSARSQRPGLIHIYITPTSTPNYLVFVLAKCHRGSKQMCDASVVSFHFFNPNVRHARLVSIGAGTQRDASAGAGIPATALAPALPGVPAPITS